MKPVRLRTILSALVVALLAATVVVAPSLAAFGDTPPVLTKVKIKPTSFKALAKGSQVTAKGGARVTFSLSDHATLKVSYRRATKSGYKVVPGSFSFIGIPGVNDLRVSGRIGTTKLAPLPPGRYRIVLAPVASGARSAYAAFKIIK
jgi:hypothetical protein